MRAKCQPVRVYFVAGAASGRCGARKSLAGAGNFFAGACELCSVRAQAEAVRGADDARVGIVAGGRKIFVDVARNGSIVRVPTSRGGAPSTTRQSNFL